MKFENAIVRVPTPISMVGIFTGKYCEKIKSRSLAEILSENGFTTLAFHSNPYLDTLGLIRSLNALMIMYGKMRKVTALNIVNGENL